MRKGLMRKEAILPLACLSKALSGLNEGYLEGEKLSFNGVSILMLVSYALLGSNKASYITRGELIALSGCHLNTVDNTIKQLISLGLVEDIDPLGRPKYILTDKGGSMLHAFGIRIGRIRKELLDSYGRIDLYK